MKDHDTSEEWGKKAARRKYMLVAVYLTLSISEVMFNRYIYQVMSYPMLMSTAHMAVACMLTLAVVRKRQLALSSTVTFSETVEMGGYATVHTLSIVTAVYAMSSTNPDTGRLAAGLKNAVPFIVILIEHFYTKTAAASAYAAAAWVCLAVMLVGNWVAVGPSMSQLSSLVFHDQFKYNLSAVASLILTAVRFVMVSRIQTGRIKVAPLELMARSCPVMFVQCLFCAWCGGEISTLCNELADRRVMVNWTTFLTVLACNGAVAFAAHLSMLLATRSAGAMCMSSMSSSVKTALLVLVSATVVSFHPTASPVQVPGASKLAFAAVLGAGVYLTKRLFVDSVPEDPNIPLPPSFQA